MKRWFGKGLVILGVLSMALNIGVATAMWDSSTLDPEKRLVSLSGGWEAIQTNDISNLPTVLQTWNQVKVPARNMTNGFYRRVFAIDGIRADRRYILHFGAVAYRANIFVNGNIVASHLGGFTPFEVDVSEFVRSGHNELVVGVLTSRGLQVDPALDIASSELVFTQDMVPRGNTAGTNIIPQGYFQAGGLWQDVTLREEPLVSLNNVTIRTSYRNSEFEALVELNNYTSESRSAEVSIQIFPYSIPDGSWSSDSVLELSEKAVARRDSTEVRLTQKWENPRLWMPGDPHLYVAHVMLKEEGTDEIVDQRWLRFGFREVWVEGRDIVINGKRLLVSSHGVMDIYMREDQVKDMYADLLSKNINAIRPHSQPPLPHYAQIADEMGMCIIGESELTFNMGYAFHRPEFWNNFKRLLKERVERDKNHPSIILWSLGNEVLLVSEGLPIGEHLYDAYMALKEYDPTRPVMEDGDGDLRDNAPDSVGYPVDIINMHDYNISPEKHVLWATHFPSLAWEIHDVVDVKKMPTSFRYGIHMPDRTRPWFMGEYGQAVTLGYPDYASFWVGPDAYRDLFGDAEGIVRAIGETTTILTQCYRDMRWAGLGPWDMADKSIFDVYLRRAHEPVTVFSREMTGHWFSGQIATRNLVILNDSFVDQEITLRLSLEDKADGTTWQEKISLSAGGKTEHVFSTRLPFYSERTELVFSAELLGASGEVISGFSQDWVVFPELTPQLSNKEVWLVGTDKELGKLADYLGVPVYDVSRLNALMSDRPTLVIVHDTAAEWITQNAAIAGDCENYIKSGGVVATLGTTNLPWMGAIRVEPLSDSTTSFVQKQHALLKGTIEKDWSFWQDDHFISKTNYLAPTHASIDAPLVVGGNGGLKWSPLLVAPHGRGATVLSRLLINEKVDVEPVAQIFIMNLIDYAVAISGVESKHRQLVTLVESQEQVQWDRIFTRLKVSTKALKKDTVLDPLGDVLFVQGSIDTDKVDMDAIEEFVVNGGTLWVHRLDPKSSLLKVLNGWLGENIRMQYPGIWLQQVEVVNPDKPDSILEGINDYHTCWSTFAWTHGEAHSIRMIPIVSSVISSEDNLQGEPLLVEPSMTGQWSTSPYDGTLSQVILRTIGTHQQNKNPGIAFMRYGMGEGEIFIDQVLWDEIVGGIISREPRARYIASTILKNLGVPFLE